MPDFAHPDALWWSLALGADFGGNLTAVGASANVVMLGIARRADNPISFWEFTRKGFVVTVMSIALSALYLWLRYFVLGWGRVSIALTILLIAFCVQGLMKFVVGFAVPYRTRIARISSYYRRDGRIISIYDSVTLVIIIALVVLLFLTDMQPLSFITGLVAGMLIIQIFFHRFSEPLTGDRAPEDGAPPRKVMSYAIQARPALAWREIALMTALFGWALYELVTRLAG